MATDSDDGISLLAEEGQEISIEQGGIEIEVLEHELPKTLTLRNGITFIVGTMIGSGIFASPGSVLLEAKSVGISFIAWTVAGIISLMGSACYAELGTVLPASGAEYVYINKALHPLLAFLFTWTSSLVTRPGSQAIMILVASEYLLRAFISSPHESQIKGLGVGLNTLILLINCRSVSWSAKLQDSTTILKVVALIIISITGLVYISRDVHRGGTAASVNLHNTFQGNGVGPGSFGLAVVSALWSYDGWNNANFVVAEMKNPARDLPLSLLIGIPSVIAVYVFANLAYLAVLHQSVLVDYDKGETNEGFAADFGQATMGAAGQIIIPLLIFASAFGATNGSLFTAARLVRESALQGHFPQFLGKLWHWGEPSPVPALISQYVLSTILMGLGNFSDLVEYFSVSAWLFYFLAILSLLRLRKILKHVDRPFRVPTIVPILFLGVAVCLVLSLVVLSPINSLVSLGFVLLGIPVYFIKPYLSEVYFRSIAAPRITFQPINFENDLHDEQL